MVRGRRGMRMRIGKVRGGEREKKRNGAGKGMGKDRKG